MFAKPVVGSRNQIGGGEPPKLERKGTPVAGKPEARRIRPITWPWFGDEVTGLVSVSVTDEDGGIGAVPSLIGLANPLIALLATAPPYE